MVEPVEGGKQMVLLGTLEVLMVGCYFEKKIHLNFLSQLFDLVPSLIFLAEGCNKLLPKYPIDGRRRCHDVICDINQVMKFHPCVNLIHMRGRLTEDSMGCSLRS